MNHRNALRRNLDLHSSEYEHVIFLGDINVETKEPSMQSFHELYVPRNLISEPTCYKNQEKPASIDLILTNSSSSFRNSCAREDGLNITFQKLKPKLIYYWVYSMFSNDKFKEKLFVQIIYGKH